LVGREIALVWGIVFDVAETGKRAIVVNVAFQVLDHFYVLCDPAYQGYESKVDIVRPVTSKTIASVNMFPVFKGNSLLNLPQGSHWNVAIGTLYVRLVHDQLNMITVFSTKGSEGSAERLDTVHTSPSDIISLNHGIG
jgi:hypothetical protein